MPHYDAQPGRESPPDSELSPAQLEADEVDLLRGLNGVAKIVAEPGASASCSVTWPSSRLRPSPASTAQA